MSRGTGKSKELRIIGSAELKKRIPYSNVHIWRLEQSGRFPKRIKIGDHRVGWDLDEVIAWIEDRKAERSQ
ncbi:helix-turn-helix transcriptional regulator [Bradyrhizobium sp. 1050_B9_N1_2]|uniref:helix-turn-helix transcriptional regulator n=1 Tax=Bradyrhizobium sp. 1050_B9_N1_2 TaxID=3238688 RepID=UPI003EDBC875